MVEAALNGILRRRRVAVVWIILGLLLAAILVIQSRDRAALQTEDEAREERMLLPVSILEIGAVEVLVQGTLHRFERDASGNWFYHGVHAEAQQAHEHTVDPEAAARIDKALLGFGRTRKERDFPLNVQADEFGVTRPEIFIMTFLPNSTQPVSRYAVGIVAPDGVSRYILPVGSSTVFTIPDYQIENLLNLIASFQGAAAAPGPKPR
jgi:hypothetical protein